MKTVGKRAYFLLLLVAVFIVGVVIFLVRLTVNSAQWASQPYNSHLTAEEGTILDSNGIVLCEGTQDGTLYAQDSNVRKAVLHTLGDGSGYISTGVRSIYRSQLSGYNILTGLSSGNATMTLTIDSDLCAQAYSLLNGYNGAVFIYNYKTGAVVCKTSAPSYDPLNVPEDLESNPAYEGVFLDRTISSSFTPGSTFKVVTAICAMENMPDWEQFTSTCTGSTVINDNEITCLGEHGTIGIQDGLKYSCNILFADLAVALGADKMQETAESLGFGQSFDFEGIETKPSSFDVSTATPNELAWSGIGQYTDLVTPYHMAVIMGSIANGGQSAKPYVVEKITGSTGIPTKITLSSKLSSLMDKNVADTMKEYLRSNVTDSYGDDFFPYGMEICAKTGTAQVGDEKADTAWISGFSANPDTPYAFVVMVEEGGFGLSTAGSIASQLLASLNS
jgi:peptidoglycan glycosyltransferase